MPDERAEDLLVSLVPVQPPVVVEDSPTHDLSDTPAAGTHSQTQAEHNIARISTSVQACTSQNQFCDSLSMPPRERRLDSQNQIEHGTDGAPIGQRWLVVAC